MQLILGNSKLKEGFKQFEIKNQLNDVSFEVQFHFYS